ncbi:MAG: hypothetical protein QOF67_365 [Mycobacterium sp.]|nr:hypothetical protein [Mycobacterium sp.]
MTVRTDNRLADAPMVPVTCRSCGAEVLARKSSWQQTSVQWDAAALARCPQRHQALLLAEHGGRGVFVSCSELRESIKQAVRDGVLPVVDETDLSP